MEQAYTLLVVIVSFLQLSLCVPGDPVMFLPPFEVRTTNTFPVMAQFPPGTRNFAPQPQQQLLHTNTVQQVPSQNVPTTKQRDPQNFTVEEFMEALNEVSQQSREDNRGEFRVAVRDEAPYPYPHSPSYGYPPRPNYGPAAPPTYHEPAASVPAASHNLSPAKIPFFKPDLTDLVKPMTTKVSNKMNGLLGLVLSLLTGSVPEGLPLMGFKDLLINGILKPLLVAKSGIKSLIAKLAIPLISLLLINLEVLITVWWLWEECPEKISYSTKPANDYNSYS